MFKTVNDGQLPTRGSKYSACVDLYAREDVMIGAGETKLIPLGVAIDLGALKKMVYGTYFEDRYERARVEGVGITDYTNHFEKSHYLQLMLRSSLSKELIIANGVGVIDLDFIPNCKINKSLNNGQCSHFKKKLKV